VDNMVQRFIRSWSTNPGLARSWQWAYQRAERWTKQSILARWPGFMPLMRFLRPTNAGWSWPQADTQLVVDGPGSCAMAATLEYIRKWNPDLRLAGSTEIPATVIWAIAQHIPVVVLSRSGLAVARSGAQRYPQHTLTNKLRTVYYFNKSLLPYLGQFLLVEFHDIKRAPQLVVQEINKRFGLSLCEGDGELPPTRWAAYEGKRVSDVRK
jgi:hypothetical protein